MLRIAILLLVVTGIHWPLALADETSGHAQTQEVNEHTPVDGASLEEIRVTAHPLSETDEHIVRPVQVLSEEELITRSISSIGEMVANEPGVTSSDYGSGGIINVVKGRILDYVPDDVEVEVALQYETVSDGMTGVGRFDFGAGNFAVHIDGMARNTERVMKRQAQCSIMERWKAASSSCITPSVTGVALSGSTIMPWPLSRRVTCCRVCPWGVVSP